MPLINHFHKKPFPGSASRKPSWGQYESIFTHNHPNVWAMLSIILFLKWEDESWWRKKWNNGGEKCLERHPQMSLEPVVSAGLSDNSQRPAPSQVPQPSSFLGSKGTWKLIWDMHLMLDSSLHKCSLQANVQLYLNAPDVGELTPSKEASSAFTGCNYSSPFLHPANIL